MVLCSYIITSQWTVKGVMIHNLLIVCSQLQTTSPLAKTQTIMPHLSECQNSSNESKREWASHSSWHRHHKISVLCTMKESIQQLYWLSLKYHLILLIIYPDLKSIQVTILIMQKMETRNTILKISRNYHKNPLA